MKKSRTFRRWLLALALGLLAVAGIESASAQVRIDLGLKRNLFIRHEPIIVTVTIRNLSGQDLELTDEGNHKWFSFQIETADGRLVPPYNPDYQLAPVQVGAGQTLTRLINLTPLYPMDEYGLYRIRGTIYIAGLNKYFSSPTPLNLEISEGRMLWQQTVGVPDSATGGGRMRTISLLAHRLPENTQLYLRIEDKENGIIYCTHQLGRFVAFEDPKIELDAQNEIHILQLIAPKQFLYSRIGLGGQVLERKIFDAVKQKPALKRDAQGNIAVTGGVFRDPAQKAAEAAETRPSVGDRPVPVPKGGE